MIGAAAMIGSKSKGCLISLDVFESLDGFKGDMKSPLI